MMKTLESRADHGTAMWESRVNHVTVTCDSQGNRVPITQWSWGSHVPTTWWSGGTRLPMQCAYPEQQGSTAGGQLLQPPCYHFKGQGASGLSEATLWQRLRVLSSTLRLLPGPRPHLLRANVLYGSGPSGRHVAFQGGRLCLFSQKRLY